MKAKPASVVFVLSVLSVLSVLFVVFVLFTRACATAQLRCPGSAPYLRLPGVGLPGYRARSGRHCHGGPAPERFTLAQRKGGRFRRGGIFPFTALKMPS